MAATLKLTHKTIGVEVRRGTYDVLLDGEQAGSVELNGTFEMPVDVGAHTLQVREGKNQSPTLSFDASEGETLSFRCSGKRVAPVFIASLVDPKLALSLERD